MQHACDLSEAKLGSRLTNVQARPRRERKENIKEVKRINLVQAYNRERRGEEKSTPQVKGEQVSMRRKGEENRPNELRENRLG